MRGSKTIVLLLAVLLTVPIGAATWFTKGTYEPDTALDASGGYMFVSPDTDAEGNKVYFNGFTEFPNAGVNPNNEVVGSRFNPTGQMRFRAWLGIWKDCDMDGYIGTANNALVVYSSALLPTNTPCADGTIFNRGGWVYEFIWIGRGGERAGDENFPDADDQRWVNDTEALVWLDFNRPGDVPRGSCPITPLPRGTTSSTGGLIRYADCFTSRRIAGTVNSADSDGSLGLRFSDAENPQKTSSLLNQDFPVHVFRDNFAGPNNDRNETGLWDENSQRVQDDPSAGEDRAFDVWDCSQPEAIVVTSPVNEVEDPTGGELEEDGTLTLFGEQGNVVEIAALGPSVNNPRGSYYDSVNATERGAQNLQGGGGSGAASIDGSAQQNCDPESQSAANDFACGSPDEKTTTWCVAGGFNPEGQVAATSAAGKRTANDVFSFDLGGDAPRGRQIGQNGVENPVDGSFIGFNGDDELENQTGADSGDHLNNTLGPGYHHGIGFRGALILHPGWSAVTTWTNTDVTINRATLEPQGGVYRTFYARLGAATFGAGAVTPKGNADSIYGFEWCQGATSGVVNGFDCDASHWYNINFGASAMNTANGIELGPRAGYAYHMRDVDCVDSTLVRGVPVRASLADASPTGPCADAPN